MDLITDVSQLLVEFFEVAIHQILYRKKIYPDGIFAVKKKYGVPVHISMLPPLNEYIKKALSSVKFVLDDGDLRRLEIRFFAPDSSLVEKITFHLDRVLNETQELNASDPYLVELRESFRTFCLKLTTSESYTSALPSRSTFKIFIRTTESSSLRLSEDLNLKEFPWYVEDEGDIENGAITPIRTIDHEFVNMHIYIEAPSSP